MEGLKIVWTILGSAAFGSALSFLSAHLTNASNFKNLRYQVEQEEKQKNRALLREKGEHLYELVEKWSEILFIKNMTFSNFLRGHSSLEASKDLLYSQTKDYHLDFFKIEMIASLYFPEASEKYQQAQKSLRIVNKIELAVENNITSKSADNKKFLKDYCDAQTNLEKDIEAFKCTITSLIRNHNHTAETEKEKTS